MLRPCSIGRGNSKLQAVIWRGAPCSELHRMDWYIKAKKFLSRPHKVIDKEVLLHGKGGLEGALILEHP